ncbi:uncharacterized protein LY79DRAFT_354102 [Colletotrichum navitas]|uniref:Uncharacterized protein n=1 Tax=Colletotrichum navitas TaxID=681940 RepID=A0AAD8V810_9PEZI|nr:uncharacterized protein LY79DRAFT_354102 [Colletotrichum navitas]KAK1597707.1 hypothetical protein LY79DRAFT_354102 [Colletotrichum navitas]
MSYLDMELVSDAGRPSTVRFSARPYLPPRLRWRNGNNHVDRMDTVEAAPRFPSFRTRVCTIAQAMDPRTCSVGDAERRPSGVTHAGNVKTRAHATDADESGGTDSSAFAGVCVGAVVVASQTSIELTTYKTGDGMVGGGGGLTHRPDTLMVIMGNSSPKIRACYGSWLAQRPDRQTASAMDPPTTHRRAAFHLLPCLGLPDLAEVKLHPLSANLHCRRSSIEREA